MFLVRKSMFTGEVHSMDLPITRDQLDRWERGGLTQEVFPGLTSSQREFIVTGVTEEEWDNAFRSMNREDD